MRISDWSSDVCSSDLGNDANHPHGGGLRHAAGHGMANRLGGDPQAEQAHHRALQQRGAGTPDQRQREDEIGRASCRARVCQYVEISVVAVSLKNKREIKLTYTYDNESTLRTIS